MALDIEAQIREANPLYSFEKVGRFSFEDRVDNSILFPSRRMEPKKRTKMDEGEFAQIQSEILKLNENILYRIKSLQESTGA